MASTLEILYNEIINDPLNRGYSGMTNAQIADDLNTVYRTRNKTSMTGDEVYQQTDPAEFIAFTSDIKLLWMSFCARSNINPFANANVQTVVQMFGSGSNTVANLAAARIENISRGDELGIGKVSEGMVIEAKAYGG